MLKLNQCVWLPSTSLDGSTSIVLGLLFIFKFHLWLSIVAWHPKIFYIVTIVVCHPWLEELTQLCGSYCVHCVEYCFSISQFFWSLSWSKIEQLYNSHQGDKWNNFLKIILYHSHKWSKNNFKKWVEKSDVSWGSRRE